MSRIQVVRGLSRLSVVLCALGVVYALEPKVSPASGLSGFEFFTPELTLNLANTPSAEYADRLGSRGEAFGRLMQAAGPGAVAYFDARSGTPTNIIAAIPLIPGSGVGNKVTLVSVGTALGRPVTAIGASEVSDLVRQFVSRHKVAFNIDVAQFGEARVAKVTDELWNISIPQRYKGIPVRYGQLSATISHGNLVLIGSESWGNAAVETLPFISAEQALDNAFALVGGRALSDSLWREPQLEVVPFARETYTAEAGYGHYLVWSFGFHRDGEHSNWEVLVDARNGRVLSMQDTNHYDAQQIRGGIYPLTNTEICPNSATCGSMQPASPMPFANTGLPAPNNFTNSAGVFDYTSGTVSTTLSGRYVRMTDTCGQMNASSATGELNLAGTNGQHDCLSGGLSSGNTSASRSGFYELNKLIEVARGWLPNNTWMNSQLTSNMNIVDVCNAFYSRTDGQITFFRAGGGCRNTGEIAAIFDHEWGHALDDNDSVGEMSNSSEAYADIVSIYRLRASCVGYGFFWTTDKGCGRTADGTGFNQNEAQTGGSYCDLNCSGVRDADWLQHASQQPATALGFVCSQCNTGPGPCGRQVHCAAAPSRQAAWDLAARDLQSAPFNLTREDAFEISSKLFYQGSGSVSAWNACTCGGSSDGCGATNAYTLWLAADDDNGNINDGTPHMTAIHAAFTRHGIACATPAPVNSGCAGAPTTAPVLTATSNANNEISLSWSAVPNATHYRVMRTEGHAGCDLGKAVIAETPSLSLSDVNVANDRPYYYVIQPFSTDRCMGPVSSCVSAVPVPCSGNLSTDKISYRCADSIQLRVTDADIQGAGTVTVRVSSTIESIPEIVTLTESPAGSGRFSGSVATSSAPPVPNGIINVAQGSSVTIEYVDASACGTPNVLKTKIVSIDCTGEACFGTINADRATYTCADTLQLSVSDRDLTGLGTTVAAVRSTVESSAELVTLTETPAGSGTFRGSIPTTGAPPAADGKISGSDGGTITVEYTDSSPCGLAPSTVQDTGGLDCLPPTISNTRSEAITGSTATIKWDTQEPATSFVNYGPSTPPSTTTPTDNALVTAHSVKLTGLQDCTEYFFSAGSADSFAQTSVDNNSGNYFRFEVGADVPSSIVSTATPIPIPDSSPFVTVATIQSTDTRVIVDVDVKVNIAHTAVGTTRLYLRHPDGTLVTLTDRHGGVEDNFTDTIFDDEATVWIGTGAAPFTGRYFPDGRGLFRFDGKLAQGTWQLEVHDDLPGNSGTILGVELLLTVAEPCGPRAEVKGAARIGESCAAGGTGDGNGIWDNGEIGAIRLTLANTGQELLTGVRATLTPTTPGVTMLDNTADFPDMPRNALLDSPEPHFTALLPAGIACASKVGFNVNIQTNQGNYTGTIETGQAGESIPSGTATKLTEAFAGGMPSTWEIEDKGTGGGAASTWTTSNPGNRTANLPIAEPFAIVDSQAAGAGADQDERLILPTLDLTGAVSARLEWDAVFVDLAATDERGDVDVLSSNTGGDAVTVFRYISNSANPDHRSIDITNEAAGADDVVITFRYNGGVNSRWWIVDNIRVTYVYPASCQLIGCASTTRPSEVLRLHWNSPTSMVWSPASNATQYTLYRGVEGDLPKLSNTTIDSCTRASTSATTLGNLAEKPAAGRLHWWLIRAANGSQLGSAGFMTSGLRQQESSGSCP